MNADEQARIVGIAEKWWPDMEIDEPTGCWRKHGSDSWKGRRIPDFLHDWNAMGLLLERVKEKGFCWKAYEALGGIIWEWWVFGETRRVSKEMAPTLPEAVAAAAEAVPDEEVADG